MVTLVGRTETGGFSTKVSVIKLKKDACIDVTDTTESISDSSFGPVEFAPASPTRESSSTPAASSSMSPSAVSRVLPVVASPSTPVSRPRLVDASPTMHLNPSWLMELKADLEGQVVKRCSLRTQEAIENNEYIEVINERLEIRFYLTV